MPVSIVRADNNSLGIVGGLFAAFWLAMIIVYRYVYRDKVAEAQPKKK
jgi:hypothetical protein